MRQYIAGFATAALIAAIAVPFAVQAHDDEAAPVDESMVGCVSASSYYSVGGKNWVYDTVGEGAHSQLQVCAKEGDEYVWKDAK